MGASLLSTGVLAGERKAVPVPTAYGLCFLMVDWIFEGNHSETLLGFRCDA